MIILVIPIIVIYILYKLFIEQPHPIHQHQFRNLQCPVCLVDIVEHALLGCGHNFCAQCVITIIQNSQENWKCPICRSKINTVLPSFELNNNYKKLIAFNKKNQGKINLLMNLKEIGTLWSYLTKNKNLVSFFYAIFFRKTHILKFLSIFLYLFSPIDLLPQLFLGPIGLIDDFGVIIYGFKLVSNILRELII